MVLLAVVLLIAVLGLSLGLYAHLTRLVHPRPAYARSASRPSRD